MSGKMRIQPIVIGGFGAAGASSALALVLGGVAPGDITIFDASPVAEMPAPAADARMPDARILALNAGSRRFLSAVGAWEKLAETAYPMLSMAISDTALEEDIRPLLLDMAAEESGEPLAHLVPLGRMTGILRDLCRSAGIEILQGCFAGSRAGASSIDVVIGNETRSARLLIGADGARSPIRVQAGIPTHGWAYGQTAIVATIRHSLPHHGEAVQHFLPSGPFALLPLDEGRSSIVWSETAAKAAEILALDEAGQRRAIAARAAGWRGDILGIEALSAHPLQLSLARRFIGERMALVADAAHVVHPLAGQGLNLGFEDCAMLAELVVERMRLGLDPGAPDLLEAYQARRRPAAAAMAYATEGINRLFSNDLSPLRVLRDVGAGLINRMPGVKRRLIAAASGQAGPSPRLFRGEAI
jgi:2-octaprenyl-6-methoxyphenol hydroxylase